MPKGKFTFTSHEAGDHTICLRSNYTGGWFSTPQVRMHLDIAVGEAKVDEEGEREHVKDLSAKVRLLSALSVALRLALRRAPSSSHVPVLDPSDAAPPTHPRSAS